MFVKPAGNAYPVGGEGGITAWLLSEGNWTAESQTRIKHTLFFKGFVYLQQEEVIKEKAGRARPCLL